MRWRKYGNWNFIKRRIKLMFDFLVLSGLLACLVSVGCFVVSGLYLFVDKKISNRFIKYSFVLLGFAVVVIIIVILGDLGGLWR
jgi:hypothetical protein